MNHKTALSRAVLAALGVMSTSAFAYMASPFASTPLHLQNSSTTQSSEGVKPHVLIQFDDSGSMTEDPSGHPARTDYDTKLHVAARALKKLLNNPKYGPNVYWGMITLNGSLFYDSATPFSNYIMRKMSDPINYPLDQTAEQMKDNVDTMLRYGARDTTPSTYRFIDSAYLLRSYLNGPSTPSDGKVPTTREELLSKPNPDAYHYRCQKNYIILFSDGNANDPPVVKSDNNGFISETTVFSKTISGISRYPEESKILFNDQVDAPSNMSYPGAPFANAPNYAQTMNLKVDGKWGRYKVCNGYCYHITASEGGHGIESFGYIANYIKNHDLKQGGTDAAGKSWDDPEFKNQTITTFTIGFGSGVSELGESYLSAGATGNNHKYINASNEQQLDEAFDSIFKKITSENVVGEVKSYSTIAPGPVGGITTGIPNLAAVVALDTGSWSSEVRFFKLDLGLDGDLSKKKKVDSSSYVQPTFNHRKLMLNAGGTVFMSDVRNSGLTNKSFGLSGGSNGDEWFNSMLPWLARSKTNAQINVPGNSMTYRDRKDTKEFNSRPMGDVLDANVLAIGDDVNGRQQFMITAANDGLVYIFKSQANIKAPYDLALNYSPLTMQRQADNDFLSHYFKVIANPSYGKDTSHPHEYMINGGIVARRTDDAENKGRQMFIVGNMGQGGRGSYALNIGGTKRDDKTPVGVDAPEGQWTQTVPLFETPIKGNQMGYTVGTPQIGRFVKIRDVKTGRPDVKANPVQYGAFISNGFNSPNSKESALYIYEALGQDVGLSPNANTNTVDKPGTLIAKIVADPNTGGLASPTLVDTDFDGVVDVAYAGDKAGNMYRFDLRGASPNFWRAQKIYAGSPKQPITDAPAIFRCNNKDDKCSNEKDANDKEKYQYVVVFGTGSDMYQKDLENTDVQSVYGIFDDLSNANPITRSQLQVQTITESTHVNKDNVTKRVRMLSDTKIAPDNHYGWYFDLPDKGERMVVKPTMILRTAIFTTRSYSATVTSTNAPGAGKPYDPCVKREETVKTQGTSWLMTADVSNGGAIDASNYQGEAYVDFFGEGQHSKRVHTQLDKDQKQEVPGVIYSGYDMGAGLTAFSTISTTKKGLAMTVNGDSGETGDDLQIKESPGTPPDNLCFDDNGYILPVTSNGIQEPYFYNGKICAPPPGEGSLRRISVREISL